jgi:hypothetical protein
MSCNDVTIEIQVSNHFAHGAPRWHDEWAALHRQIFMHCVSHVFMFA